MMGDLRKQFEEAFDQQAGAIFRYCLLRLSDRERAKEISQECFMKAWDYAIEGARIENMRALLFRIAHNLVVNEYRDRKRTLSLDTLTESGFDPEADERSPEEALEIKRAVELLQKLPSPYKEVMILRYVEDLPVKEIAHIMNESETAISVKIHRAKDKLRKFSQPQ